MWVCEVGVRGGETAAVDDGAGDVVVPGPTRPSRSAKRIVVAVAAAAVVLAGLAWWVLAVPYHGTSVANHKVQVDCDAPGHGLVGLAADGQISLVSAEARTEARAQFDRECDQARDDRRTTALLLGAGVAIAACAVSTVPSRRLTGEKLGPLR